MKVRFLADANFVAYIRTGLIRREPRVDFQTAGEADLSGKSDERVLQIASATGRILVTHDHRTMPAAFARFIANHQSPGVLIVPLKLEWIAAIEELLMVWVASEAEEWVNVISVLPL